MPACACPPVCRDFGTGRHADRGLKEFYCILSAKHEGS